MACSFAPVVSTPSLLRHPVCPQEQLVDSLSSTSASISGAARSLKRAHHRVLTQPGQHLRVHCKASPEKTAPTAESSLPVKAAWYASEAFGQAVAAFRPKKDKEEEEEVNEAVLPLSHEEVLALLRADYDRSYFVTGDMTTRIYDKDCEFADPFASFRGLYRFKRNVSNLGSFMEEVNLTITDWQESENKIAAKWRFRCVLGLPWRPILAASGGTEHYFNPTSKKIVKHVESWDISPADGLRQLIKPNPKQKKKA
eukprot:TRINITY_DN18773_c0_g1_i1.p1 TRINITY_DN18773_c0_g1~~TRINITY_DN18773_c0_g1_i1.p1  ORF type:complete len:262 (+),score=49.81 TRINITY_DN18773_c0_g1_i1:24-788(+)